jgi:hypothetical protein
MLTRTGVTGRYQWSAGQLMEASDAQHVPRLIYTHVHCIQRYSTSIALASAHTRGSDRSRQWAVRTTTVPAQNSQCGARRPLPRSRFGAAYHLCAKLCTWTCTRAPHAAHAHSLSPCTPCTMRKRSPQLHTTILTGISPTRWLSTLPSVSLRNCTTSVTCTAHRATPSMCDERTG